MTSSEFIAALFGGRTEGQVFVNALVNGGGGQVAQVVGRDGEAIDQFVAKHDIEGGNRGLYFCVSTLSAPKRVKDTVAEIHMLHQDIDLKDLEVDFLTVAVELRNLPCPPSVIVNSGNGYHAYWLLNETLGPDAIHGVEELLRRLSDLVGGDRQCCEVSRLMRLPGTHNSKNGAWTEVAVIEWAPDRRYDIEQIEEMLDEAAGPVIKRKEKPGLPQEEENNFTRIAREQGVHVKPPVDVEADLAAMTVGGGENGVHATQLRCTASLLSRGEDPDDVFWKVLKATQETASRAGQFNSWHWNKEERAIRKMCETWRAKHPEPASVGRGGSSGAPGRSGSAGGAPSSVVSLKAERDKREKPKAEPEEKKKGPPQHVQIAKVVIADRAEKGEPLMTVMDDLGERELWRYRGGIWARATSIDMDTQAAADGLKIHTTNRLRSEVRGAVLSDLSIYKTKREVLWDEHGMIPATDCLVDWKTGTTHPYRPEDYATWTLPHRFDPQATCPRWERALQGFFRDKPDGEREKYCRLLQEVAGASLLVKKPRGLARALILFGPQNAGKSQVLHVLSGLHGREVIAQPLSSLEGEHGTVPFQHHRPWVLHEAFNQSKWMLSDKVKQLVTQEVITINVKRGAQYQHIYRGAIFWATNHPPAFRDASKALISRVLTVPCNGSFDDREPEGVALEAIQAGYSGYAEWLLTEEGSGILNWAIEGLKRAFERGSFDRPEDMLAIEREIYDDANPVAQFVRDCCGFSPNQMCRIQDWQAAFRVWSHEHRSDRELGATAIGKAIKSLGDPRIGTDAEAFRTNTDRYYGGVVLNAVGMDYWRAAEGGNHSSRDQSVRLSSSPFDVNKDIPEGWAKRVAVMHMRKAHEASKKGDTSLVTEPKPIFDIGDTF